MHEGSKSMRHQAKEEPKTVAGECQAMIRDSFDVMRFTKEEHERGDAEGWRLWAGWYERASGLRWAWFVRSVDE